MRHSLFILLLIIQAFTLLTYGQLTPWEAVPLMQKGINLGNTLEPPLEGGWNNPAAQEYYFDLYKQAGFNTVRIPVRWDEHTLETSPYTITSSWILRVEQLVDWALERDLFVVINAHHDDWIKQNYSIPDMRARFDSIWSQIAFHFKDKPEKLLFEILNEPYGLSKSQNDEMHGRILSIIRKTNLTRIVIFQGNNWGGSDDLIAAAIPDDDYIIGSFHSYDPYLFGLEGQGTWGTQGDYISLENKFIAVKNWSETHNIPVFLGEFGAVRKCDYNSRMKHYRAYIELSQKYGFVACAWDDGGDFRIMERAARKWDEVKDILIHTTASAPYISLKIMQDTIVQLIWNNATGADSIFIEYRTATSAYRRIATLTGDSVSWLHKGTAAETYHYYRITAQYNSGELKFSQPQRIYMPEYVQKIRGLFLGFPLSVPGTVEAEDFDTGGEGLSWHDASIANIGGGYRLNEAVDIYPRTDGGYYISSVWPGEWFEHTVTVANEGNYIIDFHVASKEGGGAFQLNIGSSVSDTLFAPGTQSSVITAVVSDTMYLQEGEQIMRFSVIEIPYFSIDKMVFTFIPVATAINRINEGNFNAVIKNDKLFLHLDPYEQVQRVQVFDVNGRLAGLVEKPDGLMSIPVSSLTEGIYIIMVFTANQHYTQKVIISH